MAILAAIPSTSVLAVTARAVSGGFFHGAMAALGVVVGDIIFIAVAIFGLGILMEFFGDFAFLLRYCAGAYLFWLGIILWRAAEAREAVNAQASTPLASFFLGLLITLGDQKAVLFYLGFFPAFLDLHSLSIRDALAVMLIALVSVGGVKLVYAFFGDRFGRLLGASVSRVLNRSAAVVVIMIGLFLILVP